MASWANDYPDLSKKLTCFNMTDVLYPKRYKYKQLPSLLQEGPQCGLIALALCCKQPSKDLVKFIHQTAQNKRYTLVGELFSADWMCHLAKELTGEYIEAKSIEIYSGSLNSEEIINFLFNGGIMLVPYDCDYNFGPCNNNGHQAHWATISGIVETTEGVYYVIAKQGKSKMVGIWLLSDLAQSNSQLVEVSPKRLNSEEEYIVPEGGIAGPMGLKDKAVLIHL